MKYTSMLFVLAAAMLWAVAVWAGAVSISGHTTNMDGRTLFTAVGDTLDTRCFTYANATASTADLAWSNQLVYAVGNVLHTKDAGSSDLSSLATWPKQSNATARRYVFHVDAAGTVNATAGPETAADADSAYPTLGETVCPFAAVKVVTTQAAQFTLGTTNFAASGVTSTFENLSALPSQALTR